MTNERENKVHMGVIKRLLFWCAGANVSVLEKCETDHRRIAAFGALLVLCSCWAGVGIFAVLGYFTHDQHIIVPASIFAIAFSFALQRAIFISVKDWKLGILFLTLPFLLNGIYAHFIWARLL